jgi:hypothetical protein
MSNLTPGDGQDLFARWKQAWERRDVDLAMSLFTDHVDYRYNPFEPSLIGGNAVRAHWNDSVADAQDVELDAERIWVVGSTVIATWHSAYTSPSRQERIRWRGVTTFELNDEGLVERLRQWSAERADSVGGAA